VRASFRFEKGCTILSGVNKLQEVTSWEELGQWCWVQMLSLKRAWQTAPSFCSELPSAESEELIDRHVRSMLRSPESFLVTPEENKPWILARLLFGSGLLQPDNVRLLGISELFDPAAALRFLLLEEWYDSGREFWPLVCGAMTEPNNALSCESASSF
jgi:hypothetical protein